MAFHFMVHLPYDVFPDAYMYYSVHSEKAAQYIKDQDCIITKVRVKRFEIRENSERVFAAGLD